MRDMAKEYIHLSSKIGSAEIPIVAQWVKKPPSIHEDADLIPVLTQWIKDLTLVSDTAWIPCCCGYGVGQQLQLQFAP